MMRDEKGGGGPGRIVLWGVLLVLGTAYVVSRSGEALSPSGQDVMGVIRH
jgi:hypothetical protein